jgi:hypothetical protein
MLRRYSNVCLVRSPLADRYEVHEHSIRAYGGLTLSLLWWKDETILIALEEYANEKTLADPTLGVVGRTDCCAYRLTCSCGQFA